MLFKLIINLDNIIKVESVINLVSVLDDFHLSKRFDPEFS